MAQTILLVDDDPVVHWVLAQYLGRAGYETLTAKNGREAVETARRELPQLVILDVRMDEVDGLTALKELKQSETTRAIPVVMMTANADRLTKLESQALGAEVFLTKPFRPSDLVGQVQRLIGAAQPASPAGPGK